MNNERITRDGFHLKIMAGTINALDINRSLLTKYQLEFLATLQNLQQIRSMPTVKQWNYMTSLRDRVA